MTTTNVDIDLLEQIVPHLEDSSTMDAYRLAARVKHALEDSNNDSEHYFDTFDELEAELNDEIRALKTKRDIVFHISRLIQEIDCDFGAASVEIRESYDERTVIEISAYTDRRCEPIDKLYDLEGNVADFDATVSYENTGSDTRYLHWTFEISLE